MTQTVAETADPTPSDGAPTVLVIGAGPGLGAAVARRFGHERYRVALVARSGDKLETLAASLAADGITTDFVAVDITDPVAFQQAVHQLGDSAGRIDVLLFNPSAFRQKDPLHLSALELVEDVRLGVASLLTAVQAAGRYLGAGARVVVTGSMAADRPWNEAASLGVQKAALRNLVLSLDATLAPTGIRATCVTVNGTLTDGGPFSPSQVAHALFAASTTPDAEWRTEVPYNG